MVISALTNTSAWQALTAHQQSMLNVHMRTLFASNAQRFHHFSLSAAGLLLDYSKNRITQTTLELLADLANSANLSQQINALFNGDLLNQSERRPALHTALRHIGNDPIRVNGKNILPEIRACQAQMQTISEKIRQGEWRGFSNLPMTDIVNIGIGGSELGPALITQALEAYAESKLRCHFISNVDATPTTSLLAKLNPATTLFIISSKSFNTTETLYNAKTAQEWLQAAAGGRSIDAHLLAVTANPQRAVAYGIPADHVLPLWDWVGGRYSLWSAVGLPIVLMLGMKNFQDLLAGATAMDQHFRSAPLLQNMPVILALLSIWYVNFFHAQTQAIIPYEQTLALLPAYLQQAHMESQGKQVRQDGTPVDYATGPVIWGGVGTNGQHAFLQLLHQGTHLIPVDFLVGTSGHHNLAHHHDLLFASCLSQSQALMQGKDLDAVLAELHDKGYSHEIAQQLAPHLTIPGNHPCNTLVYEKLTPHTLGALIALYEHKIFSQAAIWGINCFDQWGVELGKQLAGHLLSDIQSQRIAPHYDASTSGLLKYFLTKKNS